MDAAILSAIYLGIFLPMFSAGEDWKVLEEKARARRFAEHRMNARLLRMNI